MTKFSGSNSKVFDSFVDSLVACQNSFLKKKLLPVHQTQRSALAFDQSILYQQSQDNLPAKGFGAPAEIWSYH